MVNENKKTILLVEDESIIAMNSAKTIRTLGYEVIIALTGEEAIEIASKAYIDLVLLDIDLGDSTDISEVARLINKDHDTPIVFLSSYADPEMIKKIEKIASYGYILKGSNTSILSASIQIAFKLFEANRKVKESEEKYYNLYRNAVIGIFHSTFDGRFIDVNPALARMFGYDSPEEVVKSITNISEQIYADPTKRNIIANRTIESGKFISTENRYLRKDGTSWYGILQMRTVPDQHGKPSYFEGFIEDITLRKQTEITQTFLLNCGYSTGEDFFESLAKFLSQSLNMDYVCINRLEGEGLIAQTIAVYNNGKFESNCSYTLKGTPCSEAVGKNICCFPENVSRLFPQDSSLQELSAESYIGSTLWSFDGKPIGLIAIIGKQPLKDSTLAEAVLKLVSVRASGELERKYAEDALKEREERYKRITTGLTDYLYTVKLHNGNVIETIHDEGCETVTGFTAKEFLEDKFLWVNMIYPPDKDFVVSNLNKIADGIQLLPIEHRIICKNGELRWISNTTFPKYDSKGILVSYDGVIKDITERKRIEDALRETNEYLENLFNYTNAPIIVWDQNFKITRFNHAFELLSGYQASEVLSKEIDILFPQDKFDYLSKQIEKTLAGQKWKTVEIEILRKDNEIRTVLWNSANVLDSKGENIVATIAQGQDITERKQAEEKLQNHAAQIEAKNFELDMALYSAKIATNTAKEMAEQAELANKSKSQFLANMSHEIRTPLNAIIGFSQLMNRDPLLTSKQKEYNTSIIRAGEHLLELINDILELSKVEAGRVMLNPSTVNLRAILEDIKIIFEGRAQSKNLKFNFEIPDDLPEHVFIDESKLRRIFINLIGNAVKFTDKGGIVVRVMLEPLNEDTRYLVAEIQDSGPGIPKNELNNLFKHFVQTSTGIKKGSGTGLGLAISRELATLMGGNIMVSSVVGYGSIFTFKVEIKEGKLKGIGENSSKKVITLKKDQKAYRILVVDDRKENLDVVVTLLKMVGFVTNEAVNGKEAIRVFEEWEPDMILMDLRMPVMDGYEATKQIRALEKGRLIPIIALAASAFDDKQNIFESLSMQGYIRKPFKETELFSTIGRLLGAEYIYENETLSLQDHYPLNGEITREDIAKLPPNLILQILESIAIADINQLKKLIESIDVDNPVLAKHLMIHAKNYDYDYIRHIISQRENTNGK